MCRVLVIGRAAYASLERSFPNSARLVLSNLKKKAESVGVFCLLPARRPPPPSVHACHCPLNSRVLTWPGDLDACCPAEVGFCLRLPCRPWALSSRAG